MPKEKEETQNFMIDPQQDQEETQGQLSSTSSFIPQDLIVQVLKELPAKTLLRFRTVSKLWCSIIDDPLFAKHHLARSHTRPDGIKHFLFIMRTSGLYDKYSYCKYYSVDLDPEGGARTFRLLKPLNHLIRISPCHYVNGLVCIQNRIWNPTTNQYIGIPGRSYTPLSTLIPGTKFTYSTKILFGYDGSSNAYKVLRLFLVEKTEGDIQYPPSRCQVWTVGHSSTSWRDFDISNISSGLSYLWDARSCTISDIIYCLGGVGMPNRTYSRPREWKILAFDVRREKLTNILSLPVSQLFPTQSLCSVSLAWSLINVRGDLGLVDAGMTRIFVLGKQGYWREEKLLLPHAEWQVWSPGKGCMNFHHPEEEGNVLVGSLATGEVLFQLTDLDQDGKKRATYLCYDLVTKKTSKFFDLTGLPGGLKPFPSKFELPDGLSPSLRAISISYAESVFRLHAAD